MFRPEVGIPTVALAATAAMMLAEFRRSRANERILRERGAIAADGDPYRAMAIVYPAMFVVMAVEGVLTGPSPEALLIAGVVVFSAAKMLKLWAIASLGRRWSYRVLVVPAAPLIATGPYARVRHPNYAAVLGEIAGFALITGARITGVLSLIVFSLLLRKRIATEERALGL